MKGLRIRQSSGKSYLDVESNEEDRQKTNYLKVTIKEWSGESEIVASVHLDLEQSSELLEYLKSYLDERKELLELQQSKARQTRALLLNIYHDANRKGLVTFEHIKNLSQLKTPIVALLAKDLHVPASEIPLIIEHTPLPFALLKKHFKMCWEAVLTEPCPVNLTV